jgi:5'-3' exonuclease
MEMLTRLLMDRRPATTVAVFDHDFRPAFRVAAYPGYKSDRPEDPPTLPWQFGVISEVLDAAGISRAESKGLEADDAIATLVARSPKDRSTVIVTGDRDLLALIEDPRVKVLFPLKGTKEMSEFTESEVIAKYGVAPRLYAEFATLRGDPSDGLPGVSGIGPKRAAALLDEFGSIEAILDNVEKLPPRQGDAFTAARDYLASMKTVVTLLRDAEVDITEPGEPNEQWLNELAQEYNLGSSASRLLQTLRGER